MLSQFSQVQSPISTTQPIYEVHVPCLYTVETFLQFLKEATYTGPPPTDTYTLALCRRTRIYWPSADGPIVKPLQRGTTIQIIQESNNAILFTYVYTRAFHSFLSYYTDCRAATTILLMPKATFTLLIIKPILGLPRTLAPLNYFRHRHPPSHTGLIHSFHVSKTPQHSLIHNISQLQSYSSSNTNLFV